MTNPPNARAFTLIEIMIVVAVIGIAGALAGIAMSDSIIDARARGQEQAIFNVIREQRQAARERMHGLQLTTSSDHHTLEFRAADNTCENSGPPITFAFKHAGVIIGSGAGGSRVCWNIDGRLVSGSGGLSVPLTDFATTADIVSVAGRGRRLPLQFELTTVKLGTPVSDIGVIDTNPVGDEVTDVRRPTVSPAVRTSIRKFVIENGTDSAFLAAQAVGF